MWAMLGPYCDRINIYDGAEVFLSGWQNTPQAAADLFAANWCQEEVCNGGFHQFFMNSTGVLGPEAAVGFERIGMKKTSALIRRALAFFGEDYPRARDVRVRKLDEYARAHPESPKPFDAVDDEFYVLLRSEANGWPNAADSYAIRHGG